MTHRRHETHEISELNLVPYMDIMVNLIMFMLISMEGFVQMKIINVSVPEIGAVETKPGEAKENEERLSVALLIGDVKTGKGGFLIAVDGKSLEGTPEGEPTVPLTPDGHYDYETLTKKMELVKKQQEKNTVVTIVPDPEVEYDVLVKTMDAIRRDTSKRIMFPDVLLGVQ